MTPLLVSNQLHQTCLGTLQHAIGQVCFDPAPHSTSAFSARLPDIQLKGERYEVGIVGSGEAASAEEITQCSVVKEEPAYVR